MFSPPRLQLCTGLIRIRKHRGELSACPARREGIWAQPSGCFPFCRTCADVVPVCAKTCSVVQCLFFFFSFLIHGEISGEHGQRRVARLLFANRGGTFCGLSAEGAAFPGQPLLPRLFPARCRPPDKLGKGLKLVGTLLNRSPLVWPWLSSQHRTPKLAMLKYGLSRRNANISLA